MRAAPMKGPRSANPCFAAQPLPLLDRVLQECRFFKAFLWGQAQRFVDLGNVGVVVVGDGEGELEAAGADEVAQGLEGGFDVAALPAGDGGLGPADSASELGLGEAGALAGFSKEVSADHGGQYSVSAITQKYRLYRQGDVACGRMASSIHIRDGRQVASVIYQQLREDLDEVLIATPLPA
jgi:hypothetical protein